MSFRRKAAAPATSAKVGLMVVGLGNPGPEYRDTRHNLGFRCVDEVARRLGGQVRDRQERALVAVVPHPRPTEGAGAVLLVKPQTFMNLSGRAVLALMKKYDLDPGRLWLVYDEMDIAFGRLRLRTGGSAGGHNGVESVLASVGTREVARFRLGIGRPETHDPIDFLLSPFHEEERPAVARLVAIGADAVIDALNDGFEISMNRNNGRTA